MKTYMSKPIRFKNTTTLHLRKSIGRPSLRLGFPPPPSYGAAGLLIPILLACFGLAPMAQAVGPDTDGNIPGSNNGEGIGVLVSRTGGVWNTATGVYSLFSNTSGFFNSASGAYALASNISGNYNTANGYAALYRNTTGNQNTDYGYAALYNNTTGRFNTATGSQALFSNTAGSFHTAIGFGALYSNTYGDENTGGNTAIGAAALTNNTTGGGNTAIGESALVNSVTGNQNIALGYVAAQNLTDGSNNIDISNPGVPTESNSIRIGNVVPFTDIYGFPHAAHSATYIAGINGATASGGVAVYINSDGKLGTLTSSARFKTEIKPMDESSTAILALKPVTFRYKHEIDPKDIPQFGLVAEEVEKVNPDLVSRDRDGKPYTVRYEAVNAMMLNEFLKEHRTVQQLKSTVQKQQNEFRSKLAEQQHQIEALTSGLQKVSAQVELGKFATGRIRSGGPAAQTVAN